MTRTLPKWRSILFVPAHVERFWGSAHTRGADAIQLDLEDSVPLESKATARDMLGPAVTALVRHDLDVVVRVNRDLRACVQDLSAAAMEGVKAISLPKAMGAEHLRLIDELMMELEMDRGLPIGGIRLIAMVETIAALTGIQDLVKACPRLGGIALGGEDLSADGGFEPTPELLFNPCQQLVFAARTAGIQAYGLPGSIAEFGDLDAFRATVLQAKAMGFDGAFCIHPKQVGIINQAFQPTAEEAAHAERIVAAYEAAIAEKRGAVVLDGKMIDLPVVQRARTLLSSQGPVLS